MSLSSEFINGVEVSTIQASLPGGELGNPNKPRTYYLRYYKINDVSFCVKLPAEIIENPANLSKLQKIDERFTDDLFENQQTPAMLRFNFKYKDGEIVFKNKKIYYSF